MSWSFLVHLQIMNSGFNYIPREQPEETKSTDIIGSICRVTCLYGQVQVFGFTISQGQPAQDVFSTYTHTRLAITAVHYSVSEKNKKEMKREARILLKPHLNKGNEKNWVTDRELTLIRLIIFRCLLQRRRCTLYYVCLNTHKIETTVFTILQMRKVAQGHTASV